MKKHISFIIVITILLSLVIPVMAETIVTEPIAPATGKNEFSVRQAANRYFAQRSEYLAGEMTIFDTAIAPVQADEDDHIEKLEQQGIVWKGSSVVITSVSCDDVYSFAAAEETVVLEVNGVEVMETVLHELAFVLYNNIPTVVSDAYFEVGSDFRSCSYVSPSAQAAPTAVGNGDGGVLCILNIARGEIGYTEYGDNLTKYGEWIGFQDEWCGMFISWCAHFADVGCISKTASPYQLYSECQQKHNARALGGTYTPKPGDLFFTRGDDGGIGHVGIVESVSGDTMYVIEGNWSKKVVAQSRTLNDSKLMYFGTPAYASQSHSLTLSYDYDDDCHELHCQNCNCVIEEPHDLVANCDSLTHQFECSICSYISLGEQHNFTNYHYNASSHWRTCSVCYYSSIRVNHNYSYQYDSTSHWRKCAQCNYTESSSAHDFVQETIGGAYVCTDCGYRTFYPQIMSVGGM